MPTVHRYERGVSLNRLPGVRKNAAETPTSTGAGAELAKADVGDAIGRIGDTLTRVGIEQYTRIKEEERRSANQTLALKWSNAGSEWKNKRLYGPNGAFTLEGEDALELPEAIREEFTLIASELGQQAKTPEQQIAFERWKADEWQSIDLQVRRHVFSEQQKYQAQQFDAAMVNGVQDAQRQYLDPAGVGRALASLEEKIANQSGVSPEKKEEQRRSVRSETHLGVLTNLLADQKPGAARSYFAAVQDQIDPDQRDNMKAALEEGTTRAAAQKQFDAILAAGGTLAEQRAKAKQIENPDERDSVLSYLEHEAAVNEKVERDAAEDRGRNVYDMIDKTKSVRGIEGTALWQEMSGNERSAARHYAAFIAGGGVGNPGGENADLKAYYGLRDMASTDPEKFVKMNLFDITTGVKNASLRKQLMDLQMGMRKGDGSADNTLEGYATHTQIFNEAVKSLGAKEDSAQVRKLRATFERQARSASPDKKLTIEQQTAILDRLVMDVVTEDGWFWDTKKKGMDLTIDDIPFAERVKIGKDLEEDGVPVTNDSILEEYVLNLKPNR